MKEKGLLRYFGELTCGEVKTALHYCCYLGGVVLVSVPLFLSFFLHFDRYFSFELAIASLPAHPWPKNEPLRICQTFAGIDSTIEKLSGTRQGRADTITTNKKKEKTGQEGRVRGKDVLLNRYATILASAFSLLTTFLERKVRVLDDYRLRGRTANSYAKQLLFWVCFLLARDGNYECRRIGGQAVVSNLFSCYCRFW
jgi:hypothetical protein